MLKWYTEFQEDQLHIEETTLHPVCWCSLNMLSLQLVLLEAKLISLEVTAVQGEVEWTSQAMGKGAWLQI